MPFARVYTPKSLGPTTYQTFQIHQYLHSTLPRVGAKL